MATMNVDATAVAGPSSLPPKPVTTPAPDKQADEKKKRRPKRKRAPGSSTAPTEDGEASSSEAPAEVYSTPWVGELGTTEYESKVQRLHDEIVAFFKYAAPTPDERHARAMVIAEVSQVVKRRLPKASVDTFGSVAQDLYLPDGDTDLVITTPHPYDDETKKRVLFQLAALIRNTGVTANRVQVVPRARVPIMSFQTTPSLGSLKIDLSMNAADGLRGVSVLRGYFERMPALRYLVLVLKSLLSRHGLNSASSSGLSSYGLICLVISFLQLNPAGRPDAFIEQPMESESLGVLLLDFLEYYADKFPYETSYVSVTQGKILSKEEKGWTSETHPEALCIECLLNPDNDVGRPTSKIRTIRALFRDSHALISAYPFVPSPAAHNVLGTILGVSESTLAHRALIKDVVSSGRLMQALQDVKTSGPPPGPPGRRPPPSSAQQPYPPRQYARPNGGGPMHGREPPRRPPQGQGGLPPPPAQLPPRPGPHGLPARPPPERGPQGPSIGSMREGGGRAPGGRLLDRLSNPQPARRQRS